MNKVTPIVSCVPAGTAISVGLFQNTLILPVHAYGDKGPQAFSSVEGLGFPILRGVALICMRTGLPLDAAVGPYSGKGTGETALLWKLLDTLRAGDILVADSYYCTYWMVTLGMDLLRAKTPEMVRTELWSCLLVYNLIRKSMLQAARASGRTCRTLSLTATLQIPESLLQDHPQVTSPASFAFNWLESTHIALSAHRELNFTEFPGHAAGAGLVSRGCTKRIALAVDHRRIRELLGFV